MGRFRPTLVQKLLRVVEHEQFEAPRAWSVLTRFRPAELLLQHRKPPPMRFTHSALYQALFSQYPEARMSPVSLNSGHAPLARRFVQRQLELMRGGARAPAAFKRAEGELRGELGALKQNSAAAGGFMGWIQEQEEAALRDALRVLTKRQAAMGR